MTAVEFAIASIPLLPALILWLGAASPDSIGDLACGGLCDSVLGLPWG
jgi:hypothetical protein